MGPKDNPESWRQIHEFIASFQDDRCWSTWKLMVTDVVCALEARGLAAYFRIGQSLHHIMLSTSEHHGLTSEPRVTLIFHSKDNSACVAYGCTNLHFSAPLSEDRVPPAEAVPRILHHLRRLWRETRPEYPIPDALNA